MEGGAEPLPYRFFSPRQKVYLDDCGRDLIRPFGAVRLPQRGKLRISLRIFAKSSFCYAGLPFFLQWWYTVICNTVFVCSFAD